MTASDLGFVFCVCTRADTSNTFVMTAVLIVVVVERKFQALTVRTCHTENYVQKYYTGSYSETIRDGLDKREYGSRALLYYTTKL